MHIHISSWRLWKASLHLRRDQSGTSSRGRRPWGTSRTCCMSMRSSSDFGETRSSPSLRTRRKERGGSEDLLGWNQREERYYEFNHIRGGRASLHQLAPPLLFQGPAAGLRQVLGDEAHRERTVRVREVLQSGLQERVRSSSRSLKKSDCDDVLGAI